jgi:hypothetical protein
MRAGGLPGNIVKCSPKIRHFLLERGLTAIFLCLLSCPFFPLFC